MARLPFSLAKLLRRWSRQQEIAVRQMTERKTFSQRIGGFSKSERVDAKFLLLAAAPFLPLALSDHLGMSRGVLWQAWFWLGAAWAILVFLIGLAAYGRAFHRSLRRKP